MKKILLALFFLAFIVIQGNSQITITQADYGVIDDTIVMIYDTAAPVLPVGGTGNQTWDYSTLEVDYYDTLFFVDPLSTPLAPFFPGSNLAIEYDSLIQPFAWLYLKSSPTELNADGFYGDPTNGVIGINFPLNFEKDKKIIDFPSNYLDTFLDTAIVDTTMVDPTGNADSAHFRRIIYSASVIDAWGDITTPAGTFTCLRQFITETTVDSLWLLPVFPAIWALFMDNSNTVYKYNWIANGEDYHVVEAEADAPGGNLLSASFKVGPTVIALITSFNDTICFGECTGEATAAGLSGTPPYTFLWSNGDTDATADSLCAATYSVSVIDVNNDTSVANVTLTEPAALGVSITPIHATCDTCTNGVASATASGGTPVYSWEWNTIPPQYGQTATGLLPGTYSVTITDSWGCATVDSILITEVQELVALTKSIRIYPNPSHGSFTIDLRRTKAEGIKVYNILGELLIEERVSKDAIVINMDHVEAGVYFVKINTASGTVTKKINLIR